MYPNWKIQKPYTHDRILMKNTTNPSQTKFLELPLHLIEKVENGLKSLIVNEQILKLDKCLDDVAISRIVITVKQDKSIKKLLHSNVRNNAISERKTNINQSPYGCGLTLNLRNLNNLLLRRN